MLLQLNEAQTTRSKSGYRMYIETFNFRASSLGLERGITMENNKVYIQIKSFFQNQKAKWVFRQ